MGLLNKQKRNSSFVIRHSSLLLFSIVLFVQRPGWSETGQNRWAILLSGISGDPNLQQEFLKWIKGLYASLTGPMQVPREHVYVLFDDPAKDPSLIKHISTREGLEEVCREIAGKATESDLVFVFIAGHGSYDGKIYKLNLPGRDPTAEELAALLFSIHAGRFVVANMTTCSGGSIPAL